MEAEILGPLRSMAPGETQSLDIDWYVARCPGPIVNVTNAGCANQRLRVEPIDAGFRLTGVFGLFHLGSVQLVWLDGDERTVAAETLALVNPLNVLRVDCVRRPPSGAQVAQLLLCDAQGQPISQLDSCPIR